MNVEGASARTRGLPSSINHDSTLHTTSILSSNHLFILPEEILVLILHHLQPIRPSSSFPPRFPTLASYSELCQSWIKSNPPPWPAPPVAKSLLAFSQVSKRAHQLATPLLYQAISLHTIDSADRLALHLVQYSHHGSLIKHLYVPHDGLMHGPSDRLGGIDVWIRSWREILQSASRIESIFLDTRPGGNALQELLYHASTLRGGMSKLQRLTISSLSFSFPNLAGGSLQAPNLTHLHLIQWVPPTLSERFGSSLFQTLTTLRLSRISSSALKHLVDLDSRLKGFNAQQIFDNSIYTAPQPLLLLIRECIEQYINLRMILLEVEQLADLDLPDGLTPWDSSTLEQESSNNLPRATSSSTGSFGTPYAQFSVGNPGQLLSLEFPTDIPLSLGERQEWAQRSEENRSGERLLHWRRLQQCKHLLNRYAQEARGNTLTPIEIRFVAPRPRGWDRNESLIDFHANTAACRGDFDCSAFNDDDVFDLVSTFPHLGHDFGCDAAGRKLAYWTGVLPPPPPQPPSMSNSPIRIQQQQQ